MKPAATAVLAVFLVLLVLSPARADEVVLKSGARLKGRIEVENENEVVIRTGLGRMRISRDDVVEVRRRGAPVGVGPTADVPGKPPLEWTLPGVRADLAPVAAGTRLAVGLADGHVAAVDAETGRKVWTGDVDESGIAGLAADPGALYLATRGGRLLRLNMRDGARVWSMPTGITPVRGPLLHRRGIFLFAGEGGLLGVEAGTGRIRGKLKLDIETDTPLLSLGTRILVGDPEGRVYNFADDGKTLPEILLAPAPWGGRPLSAALRTVAVGGGHEMVVYDPERQKVLRKHSVPGMLSPPLVADPTRAYVEIEGALAAVGLDTGRIAWSATKVSRPTHAAVVGNELLVTTAAGELFSLRRGDGAVRWSAPLGSASETGPVVTRGIVVVVNAEGECRAYRLAAGQSPGSERGLVEPKLAWGSSRTVHSPEGFRFPVPEGWTFSESAIRGPVLVGLSPLAGSPRFLLQHASDAQREEFALTSRITVRLLPEEDPTALAESAIKAEMKAAKDLGYQVGGAGVAKVSLGGLEWTELRLVRVLSSQGSSVQLAKRVLLAPFWGDRLAWLESKCDVGYRWVVDEDLDRLAAGFAGEDPKGFTPPDEVRVAEALIGALGKGDLGAVLALLPESLRKRVQADPPELEGVTFSLVDRGSVEAGGRREVRVRIDAGRGTRFGRILLAPEGEGFSIVDAKGLLE